MSVGGGFSEGVGLRLEDDVPSVGAILYVSYPAPTAPRVWPERVSISSLGGGSMKREWGHVKCFVSGRRLPFVFAHRLRASVGF